MHWIPGKTHRGTDGQATARKDSESGEVWILDRTDNTWLPLWACAVGTFTPDA